MVGAGLFDVRGLALHHWTPVSYLGEHWFLWWPCTRWVEVTDIVLTWSLCLTPEERSHFALSSLPRGAGELIVETGPGLDQRR